MNIYDIARLANVSTATVSRVLNNSGPISQKSREKVEAVIAREGFIPNAFAHNLNTKQSHTVGIICPVIADPNHAYPVAELNRLLRENGFEILLISTQSNAESKRPYFQSLIHRQVDAAIVIGCNRTDAEREDFLYAAGHIPVLIVNGRIDGRNLYATLCDENKAAREVVGLFTRAGYSRILYLYDSETYSGAMKLEGYLQGIRDAGGTPLTVQIVSDGSSFYQTVDTVRAMLAHTGFDAVFSADDSLAVGAAKALREANRPSVPTIGFNNTILSRCATPELSSIDNCMKQQCALTVQTLLSVLQKKKTSPCIALDARLICRGDLRAQLGAFAPVG
ncbi:MAG: LacI family DNA-binding transcriptional regulator [Candidatus Limiplasma sp.]|nr:LacI family DNA-binding transcriptional regulator [Candidatus Limiplasma sp.]